MDCQREIQLVIHIYSLYNYIVPHATYNTSTTTLSLANSVYLIFQFNSACYIYSIFLLLFLILSQCTYTTCTPYIESISSTAGPANGRLGINPFQPMQDSTTFTSPTTCTPSAKRDNYQPIFLITSYRGRTP